MSKQKSKIKLTKYSILIKNAPIETAGGFTHQLYDMIDKRELHSASIKDARKSPHSVDVFFEVLMEYGIPYVLSKAADIPANHALGKIITSWKKWRRKNPQKTMDMFIDGEHVE